MTLNGTCCVVQPACKESFTCPQPQIVARAQAVQWVQAYVQRGYKHAYIVQAWVHDACTLGNQICSPSNLFMPRTRHRLYPEPSQQSAQSQHPAVHLNAPSMDQPYTIYELELSAECTIGARLSVRKTAAAATAWKPLLNVYCCAVPRTITTQHSASATSTVCCCPCLLSPNAQRPWITQPAQ
jgi:hypothetical protein